MEAIDQAKDSQERQHVSGPIFRFGIALAGNLI